MKKDANPSTEPDQSGLADVIGLKLHYEVHGQSAPLVLLHGSYTTIPLNWANFLPRLAQDRQVTVAEMQGHGRTRDIAREFSYEAMADDVAGLLGQLGIEQADILGPIPTQTDTASCVRYQFRIARPN